MAKLKRAPDPTEPEDGETPLPAAAKTAELELSGEERLELLRALDGRIPLSNMETHRIVAALAERVADGCGWPGPIRAEELERGAAVRLSRAELGFLKQAVDAMMSGTTLARGRLILAVHERVTAILASEA